MTSLSNLNLTEDVKPTGKSETVERRQRLVTSIQHQISQLNTTIQGIDTLGRKKPDWYWLNDKGEYLVSLRYGKQPVELQKGKYSVKCEDLEGVLVALEVFKEVVEKGELDSKLQVIANAIRKNFKR